jgi:hypothetical protein
MKALKLPISILSILVIGLALSACGKTNRASSTGKVESVVIPPAPCTSNCTPPSPGPSPQPSPGPGPSSPPLSYEFTLKGNQAAATGNITTDNVLKVKFRVTAEQGNQVHKASELKVTFAVGSTEISPSFTSSNYTYGLVGETSNVVDLSSYVTPGQPVSISVKLPKNDFYCTYSPNPFYYWDSNTGAYQPTNPQYNAYPGCRKEVHSTHNWSGVIIVQTSSTQAI